MAISREKRRPNNQQGDISSNLVRWWWSEKYAEHDVVSDSVTNENRFRTPRPVPPPTSPVVRPRHHIQCQQLHDNLGAQVAGPGLVTRGNRTGMM